MAYYRGDYYRGDYYRGDLGGFFKKAGAAVVGAVKGFATGGPIGALTGALTGVTKKPTATATMLPVTAGLGGIGTAVRIGSKVLTGIGAVEAGRSLFGALTGPDGRRRRTMNHLNPKALARSTRRIEGFVKKARKIASPLGYTLVRRGSARCAPRRRKCR